jgi:hypothetical protein
MATASAGRATRVRRGRPRVPRALAARRSSGSTTGQGRKQARGQTPLVSRDAVSIASDLELGCGAYRPPKADCRRFNGSSRRRRFLSTFWDIPVPTRPA